MTERLDRELVRRGLARSRSHARALINAGQILVDGSVVERPGEQVAHRRPSTPRMIAMSPALPTSSLVRSMTSSSAWLGEPSTPAPRREASPRSCWHAAAGGVRRRRRQRSAGTSAARRPRVRLRERTNLRDLRLDDVGGVAVDLVVADVSFISLRLLVGPLVSVTRDDGWLLLLVKPQFEVGRELLGKGGWFGRRRIKSAISSVINAAGEYGWHAVDAVPSRLPGASGNREFFVLLRRTASPPHLDLTALVKT